MNTSESYSVPALLRAIEELNKRADSLPFGVSSVVAKACGEILTRAAELTASSRQEGDVRSTPDRRSTHEVLRGQESLPCYCAATMDHPIGMEQSAEALALAVRFHEIYERLAPSFGYETRKETRAFNPTTPNGRLMIAVCAEIATGATP